MPRVRLSPMERIVADMELGDGGCWLFTGPKDGGGYGRIDVDGRGVRTHRIMFEYHRGPIPGGMFVCHHCDTPACVNPAHLFLGTNSDNMKDAYRKGRLTLPAGQRLTDAHRAKGSAALTKTHCKRGHALVEGNLYWTTERGRRSRRCRACVLALHKRVRSKQQLPKEHPL